MYEKTMACIDGSPAFRPILLAPTTDPGLLI